MRLHLSRHLKTLFAVSTLALAAIVQTGQAHADQVEAAMLRANLMPTADESVDFNGDVRATVRGNLELAREGQSIMLNLSVAYESGGRIFERSGRYPIWSSSDGRTISRLNGPTSFEWSSELEPAGAEFGSCNSGRLYRISESSMRNGHMLAGSFVREIAIIGDTGGNDIEGRGASRSCNAHLRTLAFNPIQVDFNEGSVRNDLAASRTTFCPSRRNLVAYRDGMANGDQDFGRGYSLNGQTLFRISDDGNAVEAVMGFRMAEDVPDHTTVQVNETAIVARAPAGRRIVSFANGTRETETFHFNDENVAGRRNLVLTDGVANALPRFSLAVTGDGDGNDVADSRDQCLRDRGKAKIMLVPAGSVAVILE